MEKTVIRKKFNPIHEDILRITRLTVTSNKGVVHRLSCDGAISDKRIQFSNENCVVQLHYSNENDVAVFALNARARFDVSPDDSLKIYFKLRDFQQATVLSLDKIWWTVPHFVKAQEDIPKETIAVFYKRADGKHVCLVALPGNGFRSRISGNAMTFSIGKKARTVCGVGMCVSLADDPYTAVHNCFKHLFKSKNIRIPLRDGKKEHGNLRGFGWCTWNAFYQKVNEAGIIEKMEEFKEKGIIPSFVLIDDGWSTTPNNKIASFDADPEKFPNGLASTVAKIKSYGVKYVGVWHTLNLYWGGVLEGSPLFEEIKDHLVQVNDGMWVPKPTVTDSRAIFTMWYTRLKEQGVDFTKVDNQSSMPYYFNGFYEASVVTQINKGLDKAAAEIFKADIINCMGMDPENTFARPLSAVNRNSDDYFPDWGEDGLVFHAMTNAYNSLYYGELYITDYDMFWSDDRIARSAAILRAVSGGPIYTSDKVGHSDPENIRPLIMPDGNAVRCDHAGRPTLDCFYRDCPAEKYPLKIWNTLNGNYVMTIFNLTPEEMTAGFGPADIPGIKDGVYEIKNCLTGESFSADLSGRSSVFLEPYRAAAFILTDKAQGSINEAKRKRQIGKKRTDDALRQSRKSQ